MVDIEGQCSRILINDPRSTRGRVDRHRGARVLDVTLSEAQRAASAISRRKGPRHDQHGTARGRASNIEAQDPLPVISEVREAVQANVEAHEPSSMISEAQEAASPDSEAPA